MSNYASVFVRPFAVGGIIVNKKQTTLDAVLKNVLPMDDNRTYKERRLNPLYCFQDEAQGFIKRNPRIQIITSFDKTEVALHSVLKNVLQTDDNRPYKERRLNPLYCFQDEAQGFIKRIVRPEPKPEPKKLIDETNLEMSEKSYKASAQVIRDYRWFEQEKDINQDFLINFGDSKMVAPKKKNRTIIC